MGKQRELDQEAWTEAERAEQTRKDARNAKALEDRKATIVAELLAKPCEVCGAAVSVSPVAYDEPTCRVAICVLCNSCDRSETRFATRKGLDLWNVKAGVLHIVSREGQDQIIACRAITWAQVKPEIDGSSVEITTSGGQYACAAVADGHNMLAAIQQEMEIQR